VLPPPSEIPSAPAPTPPTPPPPDPNPPLVTGSPFDVTFAAGGTSNVSSTLDSTTPVFDPSGKLTATDAGAAGRLALNGGTNAEGGTLAGVVAWGRWTGGVTSSVPGVTSQLFGTNDGLHYVVGIPAPIAALAGTGTVTYNLAGWTSPTNTLATGSVAGGQLNVILGVEPVASLQNFRVVMGADTYVINAIGMSVYGPNAKFSAGLGDPEFSGSGPVCSVSCTGTVNGQFYGANASHAGIAYAINNPFRAQPNINGAAVFAR
jgi:hypothetical protein